MVEGGKGFRGKTNEKTQRVRENMIRLWAMSERKRRKRESYAFVKARLCCAARRGLL